MSKRALLSVTDKTGIISFARALLALDFEIISTGGTMKQLEEENIPCQNIEAITNFPEILDGRVKTLHPNVHGGLLYKRDNAQHCQTIQQHHIESIDLVCVNLYAFEKALAQDKEESEMIENIDIGGPSMLRSAAKNFQDVIVVCDPRDYSYVIETLQNKEDNEAFRKQLAFKVFSLTSYYDAIIANYLGLQTKSTFTDTMTIPLKKVSPLRYGENAHQQAYVYQDGRQADPLLDYKQLHGKEISFNNLNDLYGAMRLLEEFDSKEHATVVVKHATPCGVAIGENGYDSFRKAYLADTKSIFGGIVAVNYTVDKATAEVMHSIFLEIIIAPAFDADALEVLQKKKNVRILTMDSKNNHRSHIDMKYLAGKVLLQDLDETVNQKQDVVTKRQPTKEEIKDMEFGMRVVKHVKSNAVCMVKDGVTLAIGGGQTSRIWALENAIAEHPEVNFQGAILASDAFFPFRDCVDTASEAGIQAIVQPGGSKRDQESIDACDEKQMTMVFTGYRHFRH